MLLGLGGLIGFTGSSARKCSRCSDRTTSAPLAPRAWTSAIVQRAHVLRTALIPVVTLLGGLLPGLLSGAIIMEAIFNWPGMGRLFIEAASARDYPLLLGMLLLGTVLTIIGALLADIGYGLVDPRVRYS